MTKESTAETTSKPPVEEHAAPVSHTEAADGFRADLARDDVPAKGWLEKTCKGIALAGISMR